MRVQQLFDLEGKTALVTGGGRGLGRHIALGLAEAGADVVVASRKRANCEQTVEEVERLGRRGLSIACDLASLDDVDVLCEQAIAFRGRIDVLVNNAGLIWGAPTLEYPIDAWDRVFAVNVRGLWRLSQAVARSMREAGGGSIVNVSSISASRGAYEADEPAVAYAASKGAVDSLTRDLAVKLADSGVRVNAIAPGLFDTTMMDYLRDDEARLGGLLRRIPMGRPGGEDDIKAVAVFLASEASRYVTGQILAVDGGWGSR